MPKPVAKRARPAPGKPGQCIHCGQPVAGKGFTIVHAGTGKAECK